MPVSAFIIYNATTGAIKGSCTANHPEDIAVIMAANTPAGLAALVVAPTDPVVKDQRSWQVVNGVVTAIVPTDAALVAAAQTAQLAILTAAYNTAKAANVAYMGTQFMADAESQEMFAHALEAYTAVGATPSDFFAVDAGYLKVPMTLDQLKGLIAAISSQVWTVFQRWITVRQALAAARTVAETQAVIW
jgi:hypothetical protein